MTMRPNTATALGLPNLRDIKQTVGKDNQPMIDILVAHNKELVRQNARPGNWGWVISDTGIASKTSKGILSTTANGSKWEPHLDIADFADTADEWDAHEKQAMARIEAAVDKIKAATGLHSLHVALIAFETAHGELDRDADTEGELKSEGIDICELPTFGGAAPRSTAEVWSWDDDQLLVGIGPFADWRIVDRPEG